MKSSIFHVAAALASMAGTALAQPVGPTHDFKSGDLLSLGPNSYPANGVYRILSCDPASKPYRECQVMRQSPDPESHARALTMENYREMSLVGRATPAEAPGRGTPAMQPAPAHAAGGQTAAAGGACPKSPYGGPAPGSRPASTALFQQKITDSITMGAYGRFWYGVRLSDFSVGAPVRNTVSNRPGAGAVRVNTGAPVNALMYPVSTTMSVCEGAPAGSSAWRTSQKKYLCFVSANNEWTCGASN